MLLIFYGILCSLSCDKMGTNNTKKSCHYYTQYIVDSVISTCYIHNFNSNDSPFKRVCIYIYKYLHIGYVSFIVNLKLMTDLVILLHV